MNVVSVKNLRDIVVSVSDTVVIPHLSADQTGAIRRFLEPIVIQRLVKKAQKEIPSGLYRGLGPNFCLMFDAYDFAHRTEATYVASIDLM